jgi:hypothetical protein
VRRVAYRPSKVAFLAHYAWGNTTQEDGPKGSSEGERGGYSLPIIKKWLEVFLYRFFKLSQFKRACRTRLRSVLEGHCLLEAIGGHLRTRRPKYGCGNSGNKFRIREHGSRKRYFVDVLEESAASDFASDRRWYS